MPTDPFNIVGTGIDNESERPAVTRLSSRVLSHVVVAPLGPTFVWLRQRRRQSFLLRRSRNEHDKVS